MSDINPNNIQGASIVVVGYVAGPAKAPLYDKEGTSGRLEISIPVNHGYRKDDEWVQTSTSWFNYSAGGDYADALKSLAKGDKIRLDDAKFESRTYTKKDGSDGIGLNISYGTLTVLEKAGGGSSDGFTPSGGGDGW